MVKLGDSSGLVPLECLTGRVAEDEDLMAQARGGGHGLDKLLTLKNAAKYPKLLEAKVCLAA